MSTVGRLWYLPGPLLLAAGVLTVDRVGQTVALLRAGWLRVLIALLGVAELLMVAGAGPALLVVGGAGGVALVLAAVLGTSRGPLVALAVVGTVPFVLLAWTAVVPVLLLLVAVAVVVPEARRRGGRQARPGPT